MKKILLSLVVAFATFAAWGQVAHDSRSFIVPDVASITISNTFMLTNLATAGANSTNMTGITYTNKYGTRTVIIGAATGNTKNLLQDVPLWSLRNGEPPYLNTATNNSSTVDQRTSLVNLAVKWTTGSGTDQAVTFVFTPIVNGVDEATLSGEEWSVAFTPTVSSTQTQITNVPVWRWPGSSGLRLRRVTYTDTTAASHLVLQDISLNGYVPR